MESQADRLQLLKSRLEKKATFENALLDMTLMLSEEHIEAQTDAVLNVVTRCFALLKSRYSNPSFWKKGRSLFTAALTNLQLNEQQKAQLQSYVTEADSFCDVTQSDAPSANTEAGDEMDLVNILLSESAAPYTLTDLGPVDSMPSADSANSNSEQSRRTEERRNLQRSILEGIQAVYSGMEAVARGTEAIERQLDEVLNVFNSRSNRPSPPPPASKRFVQLLPKITITEDRAEEFRDCSCAICTDELHLGDEVQVLPCRHMYHPACVAPWFSQHNSCPSCRRELPTDDPKYEARKEAAAEEEAERAGQANAVSHNEHMYM